MSGFERPNYTQTPNAFYDKVLKDIDSMAELKVTLAVIRHTMGFHRDEHELSLSYLVEYTGLRRETVIDGLKRAMKRGTVGRRESGKTFAYFMKVVGKPDQSASRKTGPNLVGKPDPRKKEKESTPTGDGEPSASWDEMDTGQRQAYLVGYLYRRLDERDLLEVRKLTKPYKDRMAGELRAELRGGTRKAMLLFVLDRIVNRWPDRALDFWEAKNDVDSEARRQGANVVPLRSGRSEPESGMTSTAGYRRFE